MPAEFVTPLRRTLTFGAAAAAVWGLAIAVTGGIVLDLPGVTITSRNPRNPLLAAAVLGLVAFLLPMPNRRQAIADAMRRWADRLRWYNADAPWWAEPASLAALTAIVLGLRAWAFARPLWLDEQLIALNFRERSFADLAGTLWLGQSAPYGWLAVERAVLLTLGQGERALRLAPMLFWCATVALALWAGRRWMGRAGAFVLVVLCGFGQWLSHYPLELKHYSADAFFGLLLPVMTIWVLEERHGWPRRVLAWWLVASVGVWLSYGAIFVAPACAIVLLVAAAHREGMSGAFRVSAAGCLWLVSFALHYAVSLRHSAGNTYLHGYWASAFPPASASVLETIRWSGQQLVPLALIPGGTEWGAAFWLAALAGFMTAIIWPRSHPSPASRIPGPRRLLPSSAGVVLATVPLSAFALSIARVAPMQDRLALWIVPALYFGVALLADGAARLAAAAMKDARAPEPRSRNLALSGCAVLIVTALVVTVSADIVSRGWNEFRAGRLPGSNHGLDDRSAVRWLLERQHASDVIVTTHLGVPAFWWYGGVPIGDEAGGGSALADGTPIVEAGRTGSEAECNREDFDALVRGRRRVLFYSGFPDEPSGFDHMVLRRLTAYGEVIEEARFAEASRAVIVEVRETAGGTRSPLTEAAVAQSGATLDGCVIGRLARRW
jgi:hypothetical protein